MSHPASYLDVRSPITKPLQEAKRGTSLNRAGKAFTHTTLPPPSLRALPSPPSIFKSLTWGLPGRGLAIAASPMRPGSLPEHCVSCTDTGARMPGFLVKSQTLRSLRQLTKAPLALPLFLCLPVLFTLPITLTLPFRSSRKHRILSLVQTSSVHPSYALIRCPIPLITPSPCPSAPIHSLAGCHCGFTRVVSNLGQSWGEPEQGMIQAPHLQLCCCAPLYVSWRAFYHVTYCYTKQCQPQDKSHASTLHPHVCVHMLGAAGVQPQPVQWGNDCRFTNSSLYCLHLTTPLHEHIGYTRFVHNANFFRV